MSIPDLPVVVRPAVRRLARRLALGLFLDLWPRWAAGTLLAAAGVALLCRLFVPDAAPYLSWLWLVPLLAAIPAAVLCLTRAYRPADVVALADTLSGGHGTLLALVERPDAAWSEAPLLRRIAQLELPRLRPWRRLAVLPPAVAVLLAVVLLPQRLPVLQTALADDLAADLTATLEALTERDLLTAEEENRLAEEIERVTTAARERMDASSWEAADALRERLAATVAAKQDAAAWAEAALARAAAAAGGSGLSEAVSANAIAAELAEALSALAESGLLADAPADVLGLLGGSGQWPSDPAALGDLMASLSEYLADRRGRLIEVTELGEWGGRFDPGEFPLEEAVAAAVGGVMAGRGGLDRGRGDAPLTWGDESLPADRFAAQALPQGHARSPDDWSPIVTLPAAPQVSPERSTPAAARAFQDDTGQAAWRRTLAPRHLSAVRKYFQPGDP